MFAKGLFGENNQKVNAEQAIFFEKDGDEITFSSSSESHTPLDVLVLGGIPIGESVARYGPFVMNSREEIDQEALSWPHMPVLHKNLLFLKRDEKRETNSGLCE